MRKIRWILFMALVLAAALVGGQAWNPATGGQDTAARQKIDRVAQRQRAELRRQELDREFLRRRMGALESGAPSASNFNASIVPHGRVLRATYSSAGTAPPPSPGFDLGHTAYDMQANSTQWYQVARTPGATKTHFTWMMIDRIPTPADPGERAVAYLGFIPY